MSSTSTCPPGSSTARPRPPCATKQQAVGQGGFDVLPQETFFVQPLIRNMFSEYSDSILSSFPFFINSINTFFHHFPLQCFLNSGPENTHKSQVITTIFSFLSLPPLSYANVTAKHPKANPSCIYLR